MSMNGGCSLVCYKAGPTTPENCNGYPFVGDAYGPSAAFTGDKVAGQPVIMTGNFKGSGRSIFLGVTDNLGQLGPQTDDPSVMNGQPKPYTFKPADVGTWTDCLYWVGGVLPENQKPGYGGWTRQFTVNSAPKPQE